MATTPNKRYKKIGQLAPGGMGEVYLYKDQNLDRTVVIKSLQDGVDQRRLLDEQKALLALRSKHVVQLFDIIDICDAKAPTQKALVLEHIAGKPLHQLKFSYGREYLHTLWQIACGLSQIHSQKIVHRDIKPQNIMRDDEGVIKIIDFGLAKTHKEADTVTAIGSPPYMAPELYGISRISFDSAVDIYAFGITALALLDHAPPAPILHRPPKPISLEELAEYDNSTPHELTQLIHSCLDHAPDRRPPASHLEQVLARYLLKGKHIALAATETQTFVVSKEKPRITLRVADIGAIEVTYNDFDFVITNVSGSVFVNNEPAAPMMNIPGCCVLTFGTGSFRTFLTFDVSNPEVMP